MAVSLKPKAAPKNIYVRTVSMGKRKSCPSCYHKLLPGEHIWSAGQYIYGLWHTAINFCPHCYQEIVVSELKRYSKRYNQHCHIIMYKGEQRPSWMHCTVTGSLAVYALCQVEILSEGR